MEDEDGWVAANTPGIADRDVLTDGVDYLYIEEVLTVDRQYSYNRIGDEWIGWKTHGTGDGKVAKSTGGDAVRLLTLVATGNETLVNYVETFMNRHVQVGESQKYFVRRYGSTSYRQFSDENNSLKYYCPVIIREVRVKNSSENLNLFSIIITMEIVWS